MITNEERELSSVTLVVFEDYFDRIFCVGFIASNVEQRQSNLSRA